MKYCHSDFKVKQWQNKENNYLCLNCNKENDIQFRYCPYCGIRFQENVFYRPQQHPSIQIDAKREIQLEALYRFADLIVKDANPRTNMQALWILANDKNKKDIVDMVELGHKNFLKELEGYIQFPGFEDYKGAYEVCATEEGKVWMEEAFDMVKRLI